MTDPAPIRVALYLRPTSDERELRTEIAFRGWEIVTEYKDSASKPGRDRPVGLTRLLEAAKKGKFDSVVFWSVTDLSRSLSGFIRVLAEFHNANVGFYAHQQSFNSATRTDLTLQQAAAVLVDFEQQIVTARVKSGLAPARAAGKRPGPPGIEVTDPDRYQDIVRLLKAGIPPWTVHTQTGTGHSAVLRIRAKLRENGEL